MKLRQFRSAAACVLLVLAAGCPLFQPAELPKAPPSPDQVVQALNDAQDAVNESNTLITAVARTVHEQLAAGVITREEWLEYGLQLTAYANRADEVQALIRTGVPTAKEAAVVLRKLLFALQAKAAAKARQ